MADLHTPSRQECWDEFWDIITTEMADALRRGWSPQEPASAAA